MRLAWAAGVKWCARLLGVLLLAQGAQAQSASPETTEAALREMSRLAGVIFAGRVVAVRRGDGATGVVEVEFAVEDAVRGVRGGSYTMREWAGLWAAGERPFRLGQRYLMLLHAPGPGGLSSPVGGMDGAIPIRGGVQTLGLQAAGAPAVAGSAAGGGLVVDLRWVATRVVQPVAYPPPVARSTALPVLVRPEAVGSATEFAQPAASAQAADYTTVLAMLRSWEVDGDGAR